MKVSSTIVATFTTRLLLSGITLMLSTLIAGATSLDPRTISQLKKLNDVDQLEQRCDIEGMDQLGADKVISYTFSRPDREPTHLHAEGAVFRRNGKWFRLSYDCATSLDHLDVKSFTYAVGEQIPRKEWEQFYLYP